MIPFTPMQHVVMSILFGLMLVLPCAAALGLVAALLVVLQ